MVVYVLGEEGAKRAAFERKRSETETYVDNEEVEGSVRQNKTLFVAVGSRPFGDMSADGYVAYSRALMDGPNAKGEQVRAAFGKVKLRRKAHKKLNRLTVFDYRKALLAGKLSDTTQTVYVNFGGLEYSKRNKRGLHRFARSLKKFDLYLLISDLRLLNKQDDALFCSPDGALSLMPPQKVKQVKVKKLNKIQAKMQA